MRERNKRVKREVGTTSIITGVITLGSGLLGTVDGSSVYWCTVGTAPDSSVHWCIVGTVHGGSVYWSIVGTVHGGNMHRRTVGRVVSVVDNNWSSVRVCAGRLGPGAMVRHARNSDGT